MAEQETLDPAFPPPPSSQSSDDQSQSQSSSSTSDPSLSRSSSSSRLNAKAPEFVPSRGPVQPPPPPPRMVIPPPPPPGMLHMYHPPSPFHVPMQGPVPMPPPHMAPVQNHQLHHFPHPRSRHINHQYVPVRGHNLNNYQHYGGDRESEVLAKKGGGQSVEQDRKKDHKRNHRDSDVSGAAGSKNGLPDEAVQKILNQVEYYFSDLNLATTDHLMRFINKDPEGYVPISVVAAFKKIKAFITSNSQLATVLRKSSKLVVSEDGAKVKRQHPITESDIEELQSRVIVAENLPEDHCYQNLMKIFSVVGSVKNIRTCQPQNSSGGASSAARSGKPDGMHFSNKLHAFVEYETVELAEKAVADLNEGGNWRSGLRVRLMFKYHVGLQTKDSKQGQGRARKGHDEEVHCEENDVSTSELQPNEKSSEDCSEEWEVNTHEHHGEEHVNDKAGGQRKERSRGRGKGRGRGQHHHNSRGNHSGTQSSNNSVSTEQQATAKQQPPGPRMPDGTRGFSMGRGKPVSVNIT